MTKRNSEYSSIRHIEDFSFKQDCKNMIEAKSCKTVEKCDMRGIERGSVASDMKFEHSGGVLTIGTIADNYWGGQCTTYDRSTSFKIKHLSEVKEFKIFKVGFDDYLQISFNNHIVYVGPDDGTYIEVKDREQPYFNKKYQTQIVHNGIGDFPCERGVNWKKDLNIDLKNHLIEGENILDMRVIVSGAGEGWLQISAQAECCKEWLIKLSGEECDFS